MSYHVTALSRFDFADGCDSYIYDNYDNIDVMDEFAINNTGYYKFDSSDSSHVNRPEGRYDYLLKYVKNGEGHFIINGVEHIVPAGSIVLYRPHEPQHYHYYGKDNAKAYWIHFGGTRVGALIKSLGLDNIHILKYPNGALFTETVNIIFDELKLKKPFYQLNSTSKLTELLIDIHRYKDGGADTFSNSALEKALTHIYKNYHQQTSNDEYAAMCNMCTSYFVKLFKATTGTTPQHYKMLHRVKVSETMLMSGDYSISEVANLVGYSDALYFSRIFKKINGISPTQFINEHNK